MFEILLLILKVYFFSQQVYLSYETLAYIFRRVNEKTRRILFVLLRKGIIRLTATISSITEREDEFVLVDRKGLAKTISVLPI
jgi:hypothetical protein